MDISYVYENDAHLRSAICREILNGLPDWFGIPESNESYASDARSMTALVARDKGKPIGIMCLSFHNECTCEIHVMGIAEVYHRRGIGRRFVAEARKRALERGARLLMVKTLDAAHPDEHYAKTREFYRAVGFMPLQCIPEIWGESCPCLIMVMPL
ncbi:MAG: GNAT family N-acetyltransferase [Eubacteriales bacterium]|nr:GNAT family N-acetyltransferase [Eubacteriales bacterium]MDD3881190.1 GNAT family N-acetyltransferase [Eubacteriales bacterium]MDD4511572.1 GNAT family N-acetyltransferase [Eubacteriales bacterium]